MVARCVRAFVCALALVASCGGGEAPRFVDQSDASSVTDVARSSCQSNADCDDRVACTRDLCAVGGVCEHVASDATCVVPTRCASNAECDDRDECTRDRCLVDGTCSHSPIDLCARDAAAPDVSAVDSPVIDVVSDAVTVDVPAVDAVAPRGCSSDADCDDHRRCTGVERCVATACVAGTPVTCDDGNACTSDVCSESGAMCTNAPIASCTAVTPVAGAWTLTPPPGYACQNDLLKTTVIDLRGTSSVMLSITGSAITVTGLGTPLTGALMGNTFRLTGRIAGDCAASLTLAATLSDPRHFTGALDIAFAGPDCIFTACEAQHLAVSGALSM